MATKTQKILNSDWVEHKETILGLYLTSDLKLQELAQTMSNDYGFVASQSQYEAQLRMWNARKNLKRHEWEVILEKLDHLISQGFEPRVVISGHPVSSDRVQRARRYCNSKPLTKKRRRIDEDLHDAREDHGTNYVEIQTKGQDGTWSLHTGSNNQESGIANREQFNSTNVSGVAQQASTDGFGSLSVCSVPESDIDDVQDNETQSHEAGIVPSQNLGLSDLSSVELNTGFKALGTQACQTSSNSLTSVPSGPLFSQSNIQSGLEQDMIPRYSEFTASPGSLLYFGDLSVFEFGKFCLSDLPFDQFERELASRGLGFVTRSSVGRGLPLLPALQRMTTSFLTEVASVVAKKYPDAIDRKLSLVQNTLQELHTILPKIQQGFPMTGSPEEVLGVHFHRLLIFSISNGHVGMDGIPIEAVAKFLYHNTNLSSLLPRLSRDNLGHVAKGLAENLFRAAIESCDKSAVRFFLKTGLVDADKTICFVGDKKYTPLERAAQLQGLQIIQELLLFKVDVNKTYSRRPQGGGGLRRLIRTLVDDRRSLVGSRSHHTFTPEFMETVNSLIHSGAIIRPSFLSIALSGFARMDVAKQLLDNIAPIDRYKIIFKTNLHRIVEEFSDDEATQIIEKLLCDCEQMTCKQCTHCFSEAINRVVVTSAARGYSRLVLSLFQYATSPTQVLSAAIQGGDRDIINFILTKISDFSSPAESIYNGGSAGPKTTPLAEAIATQDEELIRTLESRGALDTIHRLDHLKAAIVAASEVGNLIYVRKLLSTSPYHLARQTLGAALMEALRNRQREIVHILLNISNIIGYSEDILITEALEWGDKSVIRDFMTAFPSASILMHMDENNQLRQSFEAGDLSLFDFLHELGLFERRSITGFLSIATRKGNLNMLQHLLEAGADASDETALRDAARGHPEMLRLLLEHAPRLNTRTKYFRTASVMAAIEQGSGNLECLDMLITSGGVDMKSPVVGQSPLALAIKQDSNEHADFPLTRRILDAGCDPNDIVDTRGGNATAFVKAIETRNKDLVQFLIARGANLNKPAILGQRCTPLQAAAKIGSLEIVELLLQHGAEPNGKPAEYFGGTALQYAAGSGICNIAATLLDHGADLNMAPSIGGRWPLEAAAECGRLDMIKFLWNASLGGFPVEQCHSAMQLAETNSHIACKDLITELAVSSGIIVTLEGSS
ncbi:ankyrin [Xylariaceae sp. FL0662B]|nr:ankyrin [Xylariaceae sp. FL0662B]